MAALSISHICHYKYKHSPGLDLKTRSCSRRFITVSCQSNPNGSSDSKTTKERKEETGPRIQWPLAGLEKLGEGLRESLSPKRKGDWKDIALMSLSFAVYVYMSQKIVCAYCLWMSMAKQPW